MVGVVLLAAASRLVYCFHRGLGAGLDHLYDDSLITLRYARNLASGLGLVYNPGESFLGTSTPLYAALMALPGGARSRPDLERGAFQPRLRRCSLSAAGPPRPRLPGVPAAGADRLPGAGQHPLLVGHRHGVLLAGAARLRRGLCLRRRPAGAWRACWPGWRWFAGSTRRSSWAGFGVAALLDQRRIPWRFLGFLLAAAGPWFLYSTSIYGHLVPLSARARYLLYQSAPWGGEAATVLLGSAWLAPAAIGALLAWRRHQDTPPRLVFFLRSLSLHPLFFLLVYEATGGRIYRRYQVALDASLTLLGCFALAVLAAQLREAAEGGGSRRPAPSSSAPCCWPGRPGRPCATPGSASTGRATRCISRSPAGWPPTARRTPP